MKISPLFLLVAILIATSALVAICLHYLLR